MEGAMTKRGAPNVFPSVVVHDTGIQSAVHKPLGLYRGIQVRFHSCSQYGIPLLVVKCALTECLHLASSSSDGRSMTPFLRGQGGKIEWLHQKFRKTGVQEDLKPPAWLNQNQMFSVEECSSWLTFYSTQDGILHSTSIGRQRRWLGSEFTILSYQLVLAWIWMLFKLLRSSGLTMASSCSPRWYFLGLPERMQMWHLMRWACCLC